MTENQLGCFAVSPRFVPHISGLISLVYAFLGVKMLAWDENS